VVRDESSSRGNKSAVEWSEAALGSKPVSAKPGWVSLPITSLDAPDCSACVGAHTLSGL
jgi:hypothetical protein